MEGESVGVRTLTMGPGGITVNEELIFGFGFIRVTQGGAYPSRGDAAEEIGIVSPRTGGEATLVVFFSVRARAGDSTEEMGLNDLGRGEEEESLRMGGISV